MIYLNNAATSWPKAPGVAEAVAAAIAAVPSGDSRATAHGYARTPDCRAMLASLLGVNDSRRIILTANATQALNIAILGFPWRRGDMVITTKAEHNSVLRPLYSLKKRGIIDYIALPVEEDGRVSPAVWESALETLRPRLAIFTHASNASGAVNDARLLCAGAKAHGAAVLVDASQTMGLLPVSPAEWGADMVAFTGHKYLLGPQGTGGLYAGPDIMLEPVYSGGTGIRSDEDEMPGELPIRLEAGTGNVHSFAGLAAAIDYAVNNPLDFEGLNSNVLQFEEGIKRAGMSVLAVSGMRTPVIAATSPLYSSGVLGEILSGYDIICRTGLHCAPMYPDLPGGTIRFSMSRFTTTGEIDQVIEALKEVHSE